MRGSHFLSSHYAVELDRRALTADALREYCGILLFPIYILSVLLSVLFLCQFAIRIVPKGRMQSSIPASAPEHSSSLLQEVEKPASSIGEVGFLLSLKIRGVGIESMQGAGQILATGLPIPQQAQDDGAGNLSRGRPRQGTTSARRRAPAAGRWHRSGGSQARGARGEADRRQSHLRICRFKWMEMPGRCAPQHLGHQTFAGPAFLASHWRKFLSIELFSAPIE